MKSVLTILILFVTAIAASQEFTLNSPDNTVSIRVMNSENLSYSVTFKGKDIILPSVVGFEYRNEAPMTGNYEVLDKTSRSVNETWIPVIKSKHAEIQDSHNELKLYLKEKTGQQRRIDMEIRVFNDGAAFRFRLFRVPKIGDREITREMTTFTIPGDPKSWIVEFPKGFASSNEAEFFEHPLSYLTEKSIAGMPLLMEYDKNCWVALTEANIDNYPHYLIGTTGKTNQLTTKLAPLPGEKEDGVKARFDDEVCTPWRVLMISQNPGTLIESEILQNLNEPCAILDPSWIKPGLSSWDWWTGTMKMQMDDIKKCIDFSSEMGWPYMLLDAGWYNRYKTPDSDILHSIPALDIPGLVTYASSKNVKIIVWLHSDDVNKNSAYKSAFPLYSKWGIAGVKIDFMDREDQQMVNWYHDIIKCAAENKLIIDFHGANKPDGSVRTWPNLITREAVMGNEYYKFSDKMNPEHNVKLAFTRMLAGQMDYTPGGFINITREQFLKEAPKGGKRVIPAKVWNTRAAELSKFVIYESPLMVVCDHPDNIRNQPGADFLKIVPSVWDDIRFLGGYPGDYVAIARRTGKEWFIGVMNNSAGKTVEVKLDFLSPGNYSMDTWSDTRKSNEVPADIKITSQKIKSGQVIKVTMSNNGGFAGVIKTVD